MIKGLLGFGLFWFAAIAPFTERGTVSFDVFLDILNPWGLWTQAPGATAGALAHWSYRPVDPQDAVPFTRGRWAYTDFGWTWVGASPASWATEHYGFWVLGPDGVWQWKPEAGKPGEPTLAWHPAPVEFRQTKAMIGWRPSRLDALHTLVEKDDERHARPQEWIWVAKEKFGQPLALADVKTGDAAKGILDDSEPTGHTFVSWQEIDRPGPDPEKVLPASMLIPDGQRKENQPAVKSLRILSLPTYWTPIPEKALPDEVYFYRPELFQDPDGVQRRILKWFNPPSAAEQKAQVNKMLQSGGATP